MFVRVNPDIRFSRPRLKPPTQEQLKSVTLLPRDKIISTIDELTSGGKNIDACLLASKAYQEYVRGQYDSDLKIAIENRFRVYVTLRGVAMMSQKEDKSVPVACEVKKFL